MDIFVSPATFSTLFGGISGLNSVSSEVVTGSRSRDPTRSDRKKAPSGADRRLAAKAATDKPISQTFWGR
jgi:hypothetical protein